MTNRLWVFILISFAAGIGLAYKDAWMVLLGMAVLIVLLGKDYKAWICLGVLIAGGLYSAFMIPDIPELEAKDRQTVRGHIISPVKAEEAKASFIIKNENGDRDTRKIRVVCYFSAPIRTGDYVELSGTLKPIPVAGNPGAFNYREYMALQGIYYNCSVKNAAQFKILTPASGPLAWVTGIRENGEETIASTLGARQGSVLLAMLFGQRQELSDEQYEDFQKTGIVHLFAVSGLHAGFLLLLLAWLGRLMRWTPGFQFGLGVFSLLIYGTMVGWPVSMIRAALMGTLGLLAYYTGRQKQVLSALAIAGLLILIFQPAALFTAGFQLSFAATWGLIYLFPLLREDFPYKGKWLDIILLPLCAELAVLPIIVCHFYLLSPVSILSNILVSYLAGFAVMMGFIALLTAQFLPGLAALFLHPAGLALEIILRIVEYLKTLPAAYLYVGDPGWFLPLLYIAAMGIFILFLQKRLAQRALVVSAVLLVIFIVGICWPPQWQNRGEMELTLIDVGQGDAILIKSPRGKFVLIDGGGSFFYDAGRASLVPYLRYRGIRKIDYMINTHPDIDHLQGLTVAAREISCQALLVPSKLAQDENYKAVKRSALDPHMAVLGLERGDRLQFPDGLIMEVVNEEPKIDSNKEWNKHSLVFRLRYGQFSALLSGDIEKEGLASLTPRAYQPCTIVKVPHHGSRNSLWPDFYQRTRPRYAVISVGRDNNFGHPHPELIEYLEGQKIKILRTDKDGAISFFSNGQSLRVVSTLAGK